MMSRKHLLISIANYNNSVEVNNFIRSIEPNSLSKYFNVCILIIDNSSNFKLECPNECIFIVDEKQNFGYLGASNVSLHFFTNKYGYYPDYLLITNSDLVIPKDFFHFLSKNNLDDNVGQISTLITTSAGKHQNPYLLSRLSVFRIYFYLLIFSNFVTGYIYLYLNSKKKVVPKEREKYEEYVSQYASHGSFFVLTKVFFARGGKLDRKAFLYGEELYVAEQLKQKQLKSICVSKYEIIHDEHKTTSTLNFAKRAKWAFESYSEVLREFY